MTKHFDPNGFELHPYTISKPAHPLLPSWVPSHVNPHIQAMQEAGIYDLLTTEQQADMIRRMQDTYQRGQEHATAQGEVWDYWSKTNWIAGLGPVSPDGKGGVRRAITVEAYGDKITIETGTETLQYQRVK